MFKKFLIFSFFIFLLFFSCSKKDTPKKISFEKKETLKVKHKLSSKESIRIAAGGMITPKEGFGYYKRFLDYIAGKTGKDIIYVDREGYAEINKLIKNSAVDLAFVCGGPYVDGHSEFGMELLVAPQVYGGTVYHSYIIVHKNSKIKSFKELKGKIFAFTDPLSNTGKIIPPFLLAQINATPETFFKKILYTKSHDKSIKAVAQGIVDGASVDSLIWEYFNRINPEITSQTKIIKKSSPYGIPPVVVRHGLNPELKNKLKEVFLNAHNDNNGKEILKGMMIDKFVTIYDSAYNSIREIKKNIKSLR
ncbi:phosphate/phosphite/phosphonate ABC transporter substrate-binding protein [Candidatus Desantisbacteria bacterium]|nr:phosphate/phosphite/phosphonate ABC transporter substrate-binding protein [Candidatus Desantisbacteria bacterium]